MALGLLLALPAAAWADATLDTSADLSTSVATPSNVGIGDNTFKIKVWAFQGNVPSGKNGEVNVGTKYNMSTTGAITADTTSTQKVDFSNINYSSGCPTTGTIPQGCPGNPFEVTATLNVASGTPNGKTGTLTVYHAPVTDSGLTADSVPATGQVKVVIPDSTPPVINYTLDPATPDGDNGWYKSNVSLTWTVTENESPGSLVKTGCVDQNITADQAETTYKCSATSDGGSAAEQSVTIKRDGTAPVITDAGAKASPDGTNGWYTTEAFNKFTASDSPSGLADPTKASFEVGTGTREGSGLTVDSGTVADNAGNTAASKTSTASFDVDLSNPTNVAFVGGPDAGSSPYFGSVPAAPTCTADDAVSGLKDCKVTGYSTAVGPHTMTATATDNAGRTATATRSYTVKAWTTQGFYAPVDMGGVFNTVKGGSTVPLKFELFAGSELTDTASVKSLTYAKVNCDGSAPVDEIETVATGGTSLRYDSTGGQFIYNWKTPTGQGCYKVTMLAQDGSTISALFKTK
jgi:hypothetical protein